MNGYAISFDAFADEFEAERHRIQHAIEAARKQFAARVPEPTLW
jgi:predicted LPLAT superfamily acyltransferase